jgi:hypothetical protein
MTQTITKPITWERIAMDMNAKRNIGFLWKWACKDLYLSFPKNAQAHSTGTVFFTII